ncbi:Succinyl-CoA Synthetase subunit [Histomonas meleagridis]|uniref:Succinyl-CoA Synthetase subunit n=1 Tax=Histomonas meleagridis TaxID=135588 RepID=UPI00355A3CA3|nr:Succinyl-CoA Synthetase subunit [Histomonas meleagridis]KAH0797913.1 Succinyl-CoA Synthetase subunit [Histomonas meleagridis]
MLASPVRNLHKPLLFVDENTRVVVQGIGNQGQFHSRLMREYGTKVVAGVHPKKAGQIVAGMPVFASVKDAVEKTDANASLIFVPASGAAAAMIEAANAGVGLVVCITEHIPQHDMIKVKKVLKEKGVELIGPNCPGIIQPRTHCKMGIIPTNIHTPGKIGIVSRSGTLTYEASYATTLAGLGQSTVVGIGGDPFAGQLHTDVVKRFAEDPHTEGIILIGEIGGQSEEDAAEWIAKNHLTKEKPVVSFIAGATAPPGKRMGHAGAIISGGKGTAEGKYEALQAAGVRISRHPGNLGKFIFEEMKKLGRI